MNYGTYRGIRLGLARKIINRTDISYVANCGEIQDRQEKTVVFIDSENAYDRGFRMVLRKKRVPRVYIKVIKDNGLYV